MSILKFNDDEEFDTSGELRMEHRKNDGWYVLGEGMLVPIKNPDEGRELIKKFKEGDK